MDRRFIEDHALVQRYLDGKLPPKGARELENWCRAHPELLDELKLAGRTEMGLKLLEAAGRPYDLGEPRPAWWKSGYVAGGLCAATGALAVALWFVQGRYAHVSRELAETSVASDGGEMVQPTTTTTVRVTPDRDAGIARARVVIDRRPPQLIDLHIDLTFTGKAGLGFAGGNLRLAHFRMIVDKHDHGRVLVLDDLLKDSNGELRMTLNSTALAAGVYTARIESLASGGVSDPVGWVTLEVR